MLITRRTVALAATVVTLAACTSSSSTPVGSASGYARSPKTSSVATGLRPVKDYAQEFCSGAAVPPQCPQGAVPDALRRPLDIPTIDPGAPCPVSAPNPLIWSRLAPGLGPGPVAPVGFGTDSTLHYRPRFHGSDWGVQKVLWVAAPDYDGPILIRGGRVDGEGGVGFNIGAGRTLAEIQLPPGPALNTNNEGWRNWPSYTRIETPGCYAYQIDGTDFSYIVVFRATPMS